MDIVVADKNRDSSPKGTQATINVFNWCNFRCIYCGISEFHRQHEIKNVKELINNFNRQGFKSIVFSGGEVTLHPSLPDWLELSKNLGYKRIGIISNGSRLSNNNLLKKLYSAGLNEINISFHTTKEEIFDEISNLRGAYKMALSGLTNFINFNKQLSLPIVVKANIVLIKQTLPDVTQTIEFLINLGIRKFNIEFCQFLGNALNNRKEIIFPLTDAIAAMKKIKNLAHIHALSVDLEDFPACINDEIDHEQLNVFYNLKMSGNHWDLHPSIDAPFKVVSHRKLSHCVECAFKNYCYGFEKSFTTAINGLVTLDKNEHHLSQPIKVDYFLRNTLESYNTDVEYLRKTLSLFSQPEQDIKDIWLKLYSRYYELLTNRNQFKNSICFGYQLKDFTQTFLASNRSQLFFDQKTKYLLFRPYLNQIFINGLSNLNPKTDLKKIYNVIIGLLPEYKNPILLNFGQYVTLLLNFNSIVYEKPMIIINKVCRLDLIDTVLLNFIEIFSFLFNSKISSITENSYQVTFQVEEQKVVLEKSIPWMIHTQFQDYQFSELSNDIRI